MADLKKVGPLNHKIVEEHSIVYGLFEGRPFAFDSSCPHKGGPLEKGDIFRGRIRCPWHSIEFDIFTGNVVYNPYEAKYGKWRETGNLLIYRTKIGPDGYVYVDLPPR